MAGRAEPDASGSSGGGRRSPDSYIGSFISLTSKSEIRYEGVLFSINVEESSVCLKNVISFGTEGRKKDGQQIPPSEKVYEYIVFRGRDIKDLQVRASPPVHSTPPVHNDPPIIQLGLPRPAFQGGLPLYQPGGSLGSWGSPPAHPNANGSGLPMPMYWQGSYGPSSGLPHVQQPSLIRQPPSLPIPHFILQQMQYPAMNVSLPSAAQNLPEVPTLAPPVRTSSIQSLISPTLSPSLPPIQAAALPYERSANLMPNKVPSPPSAFSTGSNQSLTSITLSPFLPPIQTAALPSEMSSSLMPNKVPVSSLPMTALSANSSFMSPPLTSSLDTSASPPLLSSKPLIVPAPILPYLPKLQSVSEIGGSSSSSSLAETSVPSLVTPDQLMQTGPVFVQPLRAGKDVDVLQPASTEPSQSFPAPTPVEDQGPILPLPTLLIQKGPLGLTYDQSHPLILRGTAPQTHHSYRGHGRGRGNRVSERGRGNRVSERGRGNGISERGRWNGVSERGRWNGVRERGRWSGVSERGRWNGVSERISHSTNKFTKDFDFIAMNEKFKKDEVWGDLGGSTTQIRANEGIADDGNVDDTLEENEVMSENCEFKLRYAEEGFFDSLSPNAFDRESRNGRMTFSDQMKIDTETFGDLARHHGRGGRGPGFVGRSRGAYYGGLGSGIGRRGWGRTMSNRTNY
ncbi:protein decapping 5 isoform X1 [Cinnamomum micranthum f. kanehirae]|uniref:Protein decapping 5 isoform X1 n=1 Tax=Cinnamomum micranthum f. kanehirae TaxID=337451 RepID=A0A3S3MZV3_9MAGN|nr:protein decapping 5 isoform X1 [Cinnamomum micranthum f. kanehirae]